MTAQTPAGAGTHRIRPARAGDLVHLADVEASGGQQFVAHFGPHLNPVLLSAPSSGGWRADQPGFLLVAVPDDPVAVPDDPVAVPDDPVAVPDDPVAVPDDGRRTGRPVGFAHVLVLEGHAHLEQLSVRPEVQRRGLGSRLVRASMAEARAEGYPRLSLCTYRDVPFNGPFYAALGFAEVTDLAPHQRRLREHERQIGLDRDGVRIVMDVALTR